MTDRATSSQLAWAAFVFGPLGGMAAMGLVWAVLGTDDGRGVGDMRMFLVGAVVAALLVATYAARMRAWFVEGMAWSFVSFAVTFTICFLALWLAVAHIINSSYMSN
jgi:hypothetical protein